MFGFGFKSFRGTVFGQPGQSALSNFKSPLSKPRVLFCTDATTDSTSTMSNPRKHPPNLRGKAIGLFYAKRSRKKQREQEDRERLVVYMHREDEQQLYENLEIIQGMRYEALSCRPSLESKSEFWNEDVVSGIAARNNILKRNPELDRKFYSEFRGKKKYDKYIEFQEKRRKLPAFAAREEIIKLLKENQVIVIKGETGCGKTTQVPQYILDSFIGSSNGSLCKIVCTQPRRISAISVAERVAEERCAYMGTKSDTGYQIRLEWKLPRPVGSMLFCTTGIILQQLQSNPYLEGISHIIVDEVHERDLLSDFLLINLRDILSVRKDLRVILMSATINAEEFSTYFGNCPMVKIAGFTHPVQEHMLEDMLQITNYKPGVLNAKQKVKPMKRGKGAKKAALEEAKRKEELEQYLSKISDRYSPSTISALRCWNEDEVDLTLITEMLKHICLHKMEGAILVFLPGWKVISDLHKAITQDSFFASSRFIVIPLHSLMPTMQQRNIFERPPRGIRKIILATNIAETSVTIDDVVYVIDSGKIKMKSIDLSSNLQLLQPEWVSLSNMRQRSGRAGRTRPGMCYHMFSEFRKSKLEPFQLPEMLRSNLDELILNIKILKLGKAMPFLEKAMSPPNMNSVNRSLKTLVRLNALTEDEELTPLGYHLAKLPMDVHTAKMILLGAIFSCLDPILSVAASLSFKDAFMISLGKEADVDRRRLELSANTQSDHLMYANTMRKWEAAKAYGRQRQFCWENFLSGSTLKMLGDLKRQYAEYLKAMHFLEHSNPKHEEYNLNSDNELLLKAIICAGLYPNIAKVSATQSHRCNGKRPVKGITEDSVKVQIHPKSVNAFQQFLKTGWLAYHVKIKSTAVFLNDTTPVTPYSLLFFGGKLETGTVRGYETISVDDWIVLQCSAEKAKLVMDLRKELDSLLQYKIENPGISNWDPNTKEGLVLRCITHLITSEETLTVNELESHYGQPLRVEEGEEEEEEDDDDDEDEEQVEEEEEKEEESSYRENVYTHWQPAHARERWRP